MFRIIWSFASFLLRYWLLTRIQPRHIHKLFMYLLSYQSLLLLTCLQILFFLDVMMIDLTIVSYYSLLTFPQGGVWHVERSGTHTSEPTALPLLLQNSGNPFLVPTTWIVLILFVPAMLLFHISACYFCAITLFVQKKSFFSFLGKASARTRWCVRAAQYGTPHHTQRVLKR